jgi:O-methyltransferase domain
LKFILYDWDDERVFTILQRCREAMTGGGRIAIVEMVVGEPSDPGFGALMDINMARGQPGAGALRRGVRHAARRGRATAHRRVHDQVTTTVVEAIAA